MPTDLKIRASEKNFTKNINDLSVKDESFCDASNDDLSTVFKDFHISAFSKAVNISPVVTSITLGINSSDNESETTFNSSNNDSIKESLSPTTMQSSTPEKNRPDNLLKAKKFVKMKQQIENLSPISSGSKINLENEFSYQKLIHEFDVQRRLTVDKVMRERIQNMYDASRLIKESLEHLKQTKEEETIARRLLLERKILDDIHEQEILNKPKREAEWAKDNLKEAQRIQERNQKVKEAEEEARKKSESILLKRKQIDQILFHIYKEHSQEYKKMLETIESCKDKAALNEYTATQSKILKECNGTCEKLLKKCKQGDVNEEDVENAKKLVDTIKTIHEGFLKEINKIHEEINAKIEREKEKSPKKCEQEQTTTQTNSTADSTPASGLNGPKRFFVRTTGHKNSGEGKTNPESLCSLKRKSQRIPLNAVSEKTPKIIESINKDLNIVFPENKSQKNIISSSIGFLKSRKKVLTNSSDVFDKVDIQRLRNKNVSAFRKKIKKVRFSDLTEIIDLNGFSANQRSGPDSINAKKSDKVTSDYHINSFHSNLSDCFDAKSLETYLNLKRFLENWEKNIEPLLTNDSLKKFRFSCQKAVNIPVNAISPVSGPHLSDKYLKLHNLLSGRTVEVGDIKITASQHPLGIYYCKYLLAKKFVRQGDLTVSSKPDAAFSIAAVLASLWVEFPDFGQLVLAHFQSACPYLAPVFMPQVEGQSDEDYHRSLGYHYSQKGEVEKQDSFLKRMSGIMRLYAAVLISNVRQHGKMNPLGLSEGWRWISALLNLKPRPDICATLLYDFLEVAGNEMFRAYGGQFKKILAYICQEYFPQLEKVTPSRAGGPIVRLEGFLQKILKDESIPPPHGVLPPNFW